MRLLSIFLQRKCFIQCQILCAISIIFLYCAICFRNAINGIKLDENLEKMNAASKKPVLLVSELRVIQRAQAIEYTREAAQLADAALVRRIIRFTPMANLLDFKMIFSWKPRSKRNFPETIGTTSVLHQADNNACF